MMRRRWIILIIGLLLGVAGYCVLFLCTTAMHRKIADQPVPELAWLRKEYKLSDAEFARITKLHEEYLPRCAEMCERIAEKNGELKDLLAQTNNVTPQIEQNLSDAAQLRAECEKRMLAHFYEVSRTMPPEQGKRYLEWIQEKTILRSHGKDAMAEMHQ
jgi:hypothetical protein